MQTDIQPAWFCPLCGHQNQLSFKHCTECGTMLPSGAATSMQLPATASVKSKNYRLFWWLLSVCALLFVGVMWAATLRGDPAVTTAKPVVIPILESGKPASTPEVTPEIVREALKIGYGTLLKTEESHLNFIKIQLVKGKRGYELYGVHSLFTQYAFDAGPLAGKVQDWINLHRNELSMANIVRVGVKGDESYASSTWFDLK